MFGFLESTLLSGAAALVINSPSLDRSALIAANSIDFKNEDDIHGYFSYGYLNASNDNPSFLITKAFSEPIPVYDDVNSKKWPAESNWTNAENCPIADKWIWRRSGVLSPRLYIRGADGKVYYVGVTKV